MIASGAERRSDSVTAVMPCSVVCKKVAGGKQSRFELDCICVRLYEGLQHLARACRSISKLNIVDLKYSMSCVPSCTVTLPYAC